MKDWKNTQLKKLIEMYLKFMDDKDCSPHTLRNYKTVLYDFHAYLEGEMLHDKPRLNNITIEDLEDYMSYRKERGNSSRTRENVIVALRSFWNYLCKRGYATENLPHQLDNIRVPKKERLYLTIDEMQSFLSVIDRPIIYAACATICLAGLRISELCNLQIHDVNFHRGEIMVVCGKGKKDRIVPMNGELRRILRRYKDQARCKKSEYFFATQRSKRLSPQYVNEQIHRYAEMAGVDTRISAHSLRHTFASALVSQGAPITSVQRLLGHTDLKSTNVYMHVKREDLEESVNLLTL